jgi:c-di-GMP-related signal transduction protein
LRQYSSILCQQDDFDRRNPPPDEIQNRPWGLRTGPSAGNHRHYALEPILNASRKVIGREALYRNGWEDRFDGDPDSATRIMIDNWLLYGFKDASTRTLTFLNCTRDALLSGLLTLLPKWAVLEVLETVQPDREVVKACRRLKKLGYLISLDDFESTDNMEELVELADFIKIDFRNTTIDERSRLLRKLRGSKARLIAEKVETEAEFLMAKWEGFQLFQGFYFREKASFAMTRDVFDEANCLRLLETLGQPGFAIGKLADLICLDPSVGCRLLRKANWMAADSKPVNAIRDALRVVGKSEFRKIVLLAMMSEAGSWDNVPPDFLHHCRIACLMPGSGGTWGSAPNSPDKANLIMMTKTNRKP